MGANREETVLELENPAGNDFRSIDKVKEERIRTLLEKSNRIQYNKEFRMKDPEIRFWEEEENCRQMQGTAQGTINPEESLMWWSRFSQSHVIHEAEIYQSDAGPVGTVHEIQLEYEKRTGMEEGEINLECFLADDIYGEIIPKRSLDQLPY